VVDTPNFDGYDNDDSLTIISAENVHESILPHDVFFVLFYGVAAIFLYFIPETFSHPAILYATVGGFLVTCPEVAVGGKSSGYEG